MAKEKAPGWLVVMEMNMRNMANLAPGLLSYLLAAILSVSMSAARAESTENPRVLMKTTQGDITI